MKASGSESRVTVFVTILMLFFVVSLFLVVVVATTNYVQSSGTADDVAADTFASTLDRVNERRISFFAPLGLTTNLLLDDPEFRKGPSSAGSRDALIRIGLPVLRRTPHLSGFYEGDEQGNLVQLLSLPPADQAYIDQMGGPRGTRFAIRSVLPDETGQRRETWQFLDEELKELGMRRLETTTANPSARPWYKAAAEQPGRMARTVPYLFGNNVEIGITFANAFEGGVLGADVTIDGLLNYVHTIVGASTRGIYVAFDPSDHVIIHSDPDRMFKRTGDGVSATVVSASVDDLEDPVVREALGKFRRDGPYRLAHIDSGAEPYLATVVPQLGATSGESFFVLYAVPLADMEGFLKGAAERSLFAGLVVFLLFLPVILYIARSISRPLSRLSVEAQAIQSFQLDEPIAMRSSVHEIGVLINSMSHMKGTIREMSKFVPKSLVKDILDTDHLVKVGGETRRLSLLFTDVKDFTPIAESVGAEELMSSMSEYFEELVSLIIREGGTVDKFVGDAIFAYWNAPLPLERHEHAACITTLKCYKVTTRLNARWTSEGRQPWVTRFGVHVGDVVVGNVGSSDRVDYTAVGNAVNIASRLEGLNKFYGTGILVSGEIASVCADEFLFRYIDRSLPKGAGTPLDIFELLGSLRGGDEFEASPERHRLVREWNAFYEVYATRDWVRALYALETFSAAFPTDAVAEIYLDRIIEFIVKPPEADWDGIKRFRQK
jgi:adenylate cyclase